MFTLLQGTRFGAAVLVALLHCSGTLSESRYYGHAPYGGIFDGGVVGVDYFFVLSGFIIMSAHARDIGRPGRLGTYLLSRAVRIYPVYWVVLLTVALPLYFIPSSFEQQLHQPMYMLQQVLLTGARPVVSVSWTLSRELFFYLMFGMLIINGTVGACVLLAWFLLSGGITGGAVSSGSPLSDPRNLEFLIGMTAAFVMLHHTVAAPRALLVCGAVGFGACAVYYALEYGILSRTTVPNFIMTISLASAAVICALVELERSHGWSAPSWLRFLGDASYAIYLIHFPVITALVYLLHALHVDRVVAPSVVMLLTAGASVVAGAMLYVVIDRPLRRMLRRLLLVPRSSSATGPQHPMVLNEP